MRNFKIGIMNEEVQMQFEILEEGLINSISHLQNELLKLRAGKANPHMLSGIMIDNYGYLAHTKMYR